MDEPLTVTFGTFWANTYRRRYYARPEQMRSRRTPVRTRYVLHHLDRVLGHLRPKPGARVLEVGGGMGRFALLPAERGHLSAAYHG